MVVDTQVNLPPPLVNRHFLKKSYLTRGSPARDRFLFVASDTRLTTSIAQMKVEVRNKRLPCPTSHTENKWMEGHVALDLRVKLSLMVLILRDTLNIPLEVFVKEFEQFGDAAKRILSVKISFPPLML